MVGKIFLYIVNQHLFLLFVSMIWALIFKFIFQVKSDFKKAIKEEKENSKK